MAAASDPRASPRASKSRRHARGVVPPRRAVALSLGASLPVYRLRRTADQALERVGKRDLLRWRHPGIGRRSLHLVDDPIAAHVRIGRDLADPQCLTSGLGAPIQDRHATRAALRKLPAPPPDPPTNGTVTSVGILIVVKLNTFAATCVPLNCSKLSSKLLDDS